MKIVGIGAGGHARAIMEILVSLTDFQLVGLLDPDPALRGNKVSGIPVLGGDDLLASLKDQDVKGAFLGVGSVRSDSLRPRLFDLVVSSGFVPVSVIAPTAYVSCSAQIGDGSVVMTRAVVGTGTTVGADCILNTGSIVEHDCIIDDHVHVATGASLAGNVRIGTASHIGIGAVIRQEITIGKDVTVGAGAVVIHDVPDGATVVGIPARIL